MSSESNDTYTDQILADAERCLRIAQFKIKTPGYLKTLIYEGLKSYGQAITPIPADYKTLL